MMREGAPVQLGQRKALRQDEDMSAPLTTREALVEALYDAGVYGIADEVADALLASGALTDAGKLAEDEALVERVARDLFKFTPDYAEHAEVRRYLTALAAALSAQSERAEVER